MKKKLITPSLLVFIFLTLSLLPGCQFIEDIFKVGIWVGIIIVVAVLALILLIIKSFKK
ncbi:MAG: hypothetical protein JST55_15220 [Bacteroidetes bacterium]|nr:hypothetical protein [Bacteroidota bacterium]